MFSFCSHLKTHINGLWELNDPKSKRRVVVFFKNSPNGMKTIKFQRNSMNFHLKFESERLWPKMNTNFLF